MLELRGGRGRRGCAAGRRSARRTGSAARVRPDRAACVRDGRARRRARLGTRARGSGRLREPVTGACGGRCGRLRRAWPRRRPPAEDTGTGSRRARSVPGGLSSSRPSRRSTCGRHRRHRHVHPLGGQVAVVEEQTAAGEGRARLQSAKTCRRSTAVKRSAAGGLAGEDLAGLGRRPAARRGRRGWVVGCVDLGARRARRRLPPDRRAPRCARARSREVEGQVPPSSVSRAWAVSSALCEIAALQLREGLRVESVPAGVAVAGQPDRRLAGLPVGEVDLGNDHHDRDADGPGDLRDGAEHPFGGCLEPLLRFADRAGDPSFRRARPSAGARGRTAA